MRIIFSILFFAFLGFSEINSATELTEERVADLIESMSVEEKVAQMLKTGLSSPMNTFWLQLRIETKLGYQSFGAQMRFMGITISKARPFFRTTLVLVRLAILN